MGGLDLWFTHMLTVGGRDLWFTHALNFVVKWTLEGTNATHNLPYRLHKSATPSPKATYTPNFQNPFRHACPVTVKNIGLKTIGQQNRDLTWWRFGFRVRENKSVRLVAPSATGLKKEKRKVVRDHVRQRAVRILFSVIVNKAIREPTPDCAQK